MGSGLIFALLLVMWLAYLVPWFARRGQNLGEDEATERFSESMTIIKRSTDPFHESSDPDLEVSTPLTRSAARHEIYQSNRLAARRRRRVMGFLLLATIATSVLALVDTPVRVPLWAPVIPAGLLLAFVVVARFSVVTLNRTLDARLERLERGNDEDTVSFEVPQELREDPTLADGEFSVELSGPVGQTSSLWDPIPVTQPTYVSKPMVPRTVRTIDLSMPETALRSRPVVAEREDEEVPATEATLSVEAVQDELPKASGE